MPSDSDGGRHLVVYQKWMGLAPDPRGRLPNEASPGPRHCSHQDTKTDLGMSRPVELVTLCPATDALTPAASAPAPSAEPPDNPDASSAPAPAAPRQSHGENLTESAHSQ